MINDILIISNTKKFSVDTEEKVNNIVDLISKYNKQVHMFKEDMMLYSVVRDNDKVCAMSSLSSGADLLLFNRANSDLYNSNDKVKVITPDYNAIYKKAISRFPTPSRENSFDEIDYQSRRMSVMNSRMRFAISQIAKSYQFVVIIQDSKENNLINSITPEYGDGKFIYIYDCNKKRTTFYIGGCIVPEENFENFLKGA